jgi:GxxExxY protein
MLIELNKAGLNADSQKPIKVYCDNEIVGDFVADIIVNDTIILELKSVRRIVRAHEVQLVNYLVATGKAVGLLLNFGERKVDVKRKIWILE